MCDNVDEWGAALDAVDKYTAAMDTLNGALSEGFFALSSEMTSNYLSLHRACTDLSACDLFCLKPGNVDVG